MKLTRVAVLRGGPSDEYTVSMETGRAVLGALAKLQYATKDIVITRQGVWLDGGIARRPEQALEAVDVVFLALHGSFGEDGSVQRLLERLHIPFTGSRSFPSAVALNKHLTKEQLRRHGVRTPAHMKLTREGVADPYRTALSIQSLFGPHYIVKPVASGSSLGTTVVREPASLALTITNALTDYEAVLVEEYIAGKEATAGVVEGFRGERLYQLPPTEIIPPATASFFAYEVKYNGASEEICPGRFSASEKAELLRTAAFVHETLGLSQYSRSDFIVRGGEIYFLEVNTLPGLTPQSLFPRALDAVGARYEDLITHLVETASVR